MVHVRKEVIFKQVGAKIAYYRRLKGLTQTELASVSNLSRSALGRIERGQYNGNVSLSVLIDIAGGLHIDFSLLLAFSEAERHMWEET